MTGLYWVRVKDRVRHEGKVEGGGGGLGGVYIEIHICAENMWDHSRLRMR
jgi:hypothetical protein